MKYWLFALAALPALGQNISVGVRGGIPLNDAISVAHNPSFGFATERPTYALGPTFEVRLPLGLGFTIDALYRKIGVTGSATTATTGTITTTTSNSNSFSFWQFPVMAKYRMGVGPVRPFISGGPSFSKLGGVGSAASCVVSLGSGGCFGKVLKTSGTGIVLGAGVDIKLPVIRLAPEIRYTRLGSNFFEGITGASLSSQRNQMEVLVGVTF